MLKLGLIKSGIQLLTGYGVGLVADNALGMVKPKNLTGLKKVAVKVGTYTISAMAVGKATDYVEEVWDDIEKDFKDLINRPKVVTEEEEIEAE